MVSSLLRGGLRGGAIGAALAVTMGLASTLAACASTTTSANGSPVGAAGAASGTVSGAPASPATSPTPSSPSPASAPASVNPGGPMRTAPPTPGAPSSTFAPAATVPTPPAHSKYVAIDQETQSADGRTLYLEIEARGGACGQYLVVLQQSASDVHVGLAQLQPKVGVMCPMYIGPRTFPVKLSSPVAAREVIDLATGKRLGP
jgi:hypothetical protein